MNAYQREVWDMLAANRGGIPKQCDFCQQPYSPTRHPVPDEACTWACTECLEKWQAEDRTQAT